MPDVEVNVRCLKGDGDRITEFRTRLPRLFAWTGSGLSGLAQASP